MAIRSLSPRLLRRIRTLVITVVVILGLLIAQPFLWRLVGSMTIRLQDKRSQIQQVTEMKSRIKAAEDNLKEQQASLNQLTAVVPMNRDTIQILERVEGVASQMNLAVEVAGIAEGEPYNYGGAGGIPVFPLVVAVTALGQPSQLLEYIEAMEHVRELVQVKSFAISSGGGGLFSLDMSITFYLQ